MVVKNGFGEAASVKIPGANEKDPVIHARMRELNRKRGQRYRLAEF